MEVDKDMVGHWASIMILETKISGHHATRATDQVQPCLALQKVKWPAILPET